MKNLWIPLALALSLGACGLSPQTVSVRPLLDVASSPVGRDRLLYLEVVDARPRKEFGARGGIYNSAWITPRTDVALGVRKSLAERLTANGFAVMAEPVDNGLKLRVDLTAIDYTTQGVGAKIVTAVESTMKFEVSSIGGRNSSAVTARREVETFTPLNEAENETLINQSVGQVLVRMLNDPAVRDLLAR